LLARDQNQRVFGAAGVARIVRPTQDDSPALLWASVLRLRYGTVPNAGAVCRALLARMAPTRDIVALVQPASQLEHALLHSVAEDRLFRLPACFEDERLHANGPLIYAGSVDLDVSAGAALPWPHVAQPGRRLRRLDTLFPRHGDVGMIIIGDATAAPEVLRGARAILAGAAPRVVLDLATMPMAQRLGAWKAVAAELAAYDYVWHDAMLQPCCVDDTVLAVLRDPVVTALPQAAPVCGVAALAALGWNTPIGAAEPVPPRAVTVFDSALACHGFHPAQTDGAATWRWSGAALDCAFAMPSPGPGTWRLTLCVADWGVVETPTHLQARANGQALRLQTATADTICFGDVIIPPDADPGRLLITLAMPRPQRLFAEDPTLCGIAVTRAILSKPEAGSA
jgi:hypothetical protein